MRIALLNTTTPFFRGGAEILVDDLAEQLSIRGHRVTTFRIPMPDIFGRPWIHMIEAIKMMRLDDFDRVITFKFPAYCIEHRNKVVWMLHQFRQVYELWNTEYGLKESPENLAQRDIIMRADRSLCEARHLFTNAKEVSWRLKKYNDIDSEVLPPPLKNVENYYCASTGDYFYYPSRVNSFKRQLLAVQAMEHVRSGVKLVISGVCEDSNYDNEIRSIIKTKKLKDKVKYDNKWVSDKEKQDLMAASLGVLYLPYKEDSCGFVSMEAFYSSKPLISCTDSGGTYELVEQGVSGLFCEPEPRALAAAMDKLYLNRDAAIQMGINGHDEIIRRDITWESTIRRLLS